MNAKWVLDMFEKEKTWLEGQPDMIPWKEGCSGLARRLQEWLETYSEHVCEAVVNDDHEAWSEHVERLWQCLAYHWRQALEANGGGIEAQAVAERIQSGLGYQGGGRLGGDPLRDVVLAVAMTSRDGKAPTVFHDDYYAFSRGLAGKLNRRLADDPDQWWNELVDHLAGYTKPPGRLTRFFGRCGLRNWLGTVQWNFLKRWIRREWKCADYSDCDDERTHAPVDAGAAVDESLRRFVDVVRRALAALSKDDVLLLYYLYVEGLKLKDVAAILRIAPGNVTRRRQKALARLKDLIEQTARRLCGESTGDRFGEEITDDPRGFAESLRKAIEEAREEES